MSESTALATTGFSFGDVSNLTERERTNVLARFSKFTSDPDYKLEELLGKEMAVVDAVYHPIQLTDIKTGEVKDSTRCVFLTSDDETIACVSDGAKRFIDLLHQVYNSFPLKTPILITPTQVNTRAGNRTYNFVVKEDGSSE